MSLHISNSSLTIAELNAQSQALNIQNTFDIASKTQTSFTGSLGKDIISIILEYLVTEAPPAERSLIEKTRSWMDLTDSFAGLRPLIAGENSTFNKFPQMYEDVLTLVKQKISGAVENALIEGCANRDTDIIQRCVSYGLNINNLYPHENVLHAYNFSCNTQFLDDGSQRLSCLYVTTAVGNVVNLDYLKSIGARLPQPHTRNAPENCIVEAAILFNNMYNLDWCIANNCDVNSVGMDGFPPLHNAVTRHNFTAVRKLVDARADVHYRIYDETPLSIARAIQRASLPHTYPRTAPKNEYYCVNLRGTLRGSSLGEDLANANNDIINLLVLNGAQEHIPNHHNSKKCGISYKTIATVMVVFLGVMIALNMRNH